MAMVEHPKSGGEAVDAEPSHLQRADLAGGWRGVVMPTVVLFRFMLPRLRLPPKSIWSSAIGASMPKATLERGWSPRLRLVRLLFGAYPSLGFISEEGKRGFQRVHVSGEDSRCRRHEDNEGPLEIVIPAGLGSHTGCR